MRDEADLGQGRNYASKVGWGSDSGFARIEGEAREVGVGYRKGARRAPLQKSFGILNFKSFNLVYS